MILPLGSSIHDILPDNARGMLNNSTQKHPTLESILEYSQIIWYTLRETNIAPENRWLEDEISFWDGLVSGAYVGFREGVYIYNII